VADWLLVAAYPTTFRPSPTGFSAASIDSGRAVFAANCAVCHGKAGDGVGGRGPDADLRQHHIWDHPEGDLFWFVSNGVEGPDGKPAMPPFAAMLPEAARWAAIDFVYALNVGSVAQGIDGWPHRVAAPDLALTCAGRTAESLNGLRGTAIRLLLGPLMEPPPPLPRVNGIDWVTVWVTDDAAEPPTGIDCVARGGAAAYAVLAGAADGHVSPARFLIDPLGVLRSVWRQGDGPAWGDPASLLAEARTICTEPLTIDNGEFHEHR
jgi:mono/diheme cytochrome c family protein